MGTERHRPRDQVVESLVTKLIRTYPGWRVTTHTTPAGRQVQMIEYADVDGTFESGLPGEFVSMVASHGEADDG